jgi:hypothetical protein
MSSTPRLPSANPGQRAGLSNVLAHAIGPMTAFSRLYGTMWSHGKVDHATKEIVRLRNARITDCGY